MNFFITKKELIESNTLPTFLNLKQTSFTNVIYQRLNISLKYVNVVFMLFFIIIVVAFNDDELNINILVATNHLIALRLKSKNSF